ncbi:ABC transporter substrate-binding protein [Puniceicoccales bacterium CK1056]|uniref:ABC transporter substrate-binding protein n=1 Tax=Oceanipulchritudo coccoides TaxID=2706888 RepID=A0A6B2LXU5_9BACT|nr:ABC transporter substrate-binding protein [Oceanipulchritudo coccoides]NDV60829.1 ABC transporter substrate-binding protein [Oceanipulchritudo coccoides]
MRFLSFFGLFFTGALLLSTGCSRQTDTTTSEGPATFIFARGADAQKLDPADVDDGESVNTMAQIFEGLIGFKPGSLEVEPRLAKSYVISDDGLSYTFVLREGVRFHDGTPLTAESARFSFDRQMDPDHPAHFPGASFQYWQNLYSDIERLESVDEMTLRFHLSRPNAGLLTAFASFPAWLVSPGGFEEYGDQMVFHPVGTGPYRFVSWRPNEAIIFEANPDYWREPAAGFDRMVMRSIPLNSSRLSELLAGNIHGLDGIQPSELADLESDTRFQILHAPGMNVGYLAFSELSDRVKDPDLRRAIAMAIDRANIVRLALDNFGSVAAYPAPASFLGIPDDDGPINHDPSAAKALVEAHPEWTESPLTLATFGQPRMYFPDPQRIASLIRNDLEKAGFKVEIINREFKSHLHTTRKGDFEMALLGWIADTPDPDNFLSTFFHSRAAVPGSATNISFYRNPEMDQLLDAALAVSNRAEREALYARVLELWARDLPLVPLVQGDQITVLDRNIGGYALSPTGNHFFGPVYWNSGDMPANAQ